MSILRIIFFVALAVHAAAISGPVNGLTCAQGSRVSGWVGTQFCPACTVLTASSRSAQKVNNATCLQCSLWCPLTARAGESRSNDSVTGGDVDCSSHDVLGFDHSEGNPGLALLVSERVVEKLSAGRPEVAAALSIFQWNGRREGLIRSDELVVSFMGMPTTETSTYIKRFGGVSDFDGTFIPLPAGQWVKVDVSIRPKADGASIDFVVQSTLNERDRVLQSFPLVVLSAPVTKARIDDIQGASEDIIALEIEHFSGLDPSRAR